MHFAADIMKEHGISAADDDAIDRAWALCGDDGPLKKRGYKCNMNRFHGFTQRAEEEVGHWNTRLFQLMLVALEQDFVGLRGVAKLRLPCSREQLIGLRGGGQTTGTSRGVPTADDKALRNAAANAYAMSALMYSDVTNRWKLNMFLSAARHNKKWQGKSNKRLRQVSATAPWLLEQTSGGAFVASLADMVRELGRTASLEESGFQLPPLEDHS